MGPAASVDIMTITMVGRSNIRLLTYVRTLTKGMVTGSCVTTVVGTVPAELGPLPAGAPSVSTVASTFTASNNEMRMNHVYSIQRSRRLRKRAQKTDK